MARWLLKTEPSAYSFERLVKEKRTRWDGVTNPAALKNLRAMKKGDAVIVYHTGDVRACVGLARAASDGYPDPKNAKLAVVDLEPDRALAKPVPLDAIKKNPRFKDFALVRIGRLSVVAVPDDLWNDLMKMSS
jgi:predicted RNA-binding protein with PUA-like domain